MSLTEFCLDIGSALLMGFVIGLERQYGQHPAGLRTNALVCLGAAMFVSLSRLAGDTNSPTRVASYVVSGIGFLGGGVILREGLNVRGLNTAATLWCTAAIGALSGSGFPVYGLVGTIVVCGLHLGLRPVAHWIDTRRRTAIDVETHYRIRVVCQQTHEGTIRNILLRHINSNPKLVVQGISIQAAELDREGVIADVYAVERSDRALQDIMSRINIEPSVTAVSWERLPGQGAL
jgi:putative Mg2+ transporter-C (MgtC) family protein